MHRVLVLKAELVYAEALAATAKAIFPQADVTFSNRVERVARALQVGPLDLLVTGLGITDGDMLDFLYLAMTGQRAIRRVLVASGRHDWRTLESLNRLPVDGVFDTDGGTLGEFADALRAVAAGSGYWSRSFHLGARSRPSPGSDPELYLTPVEQMVLAVIGDGSDDRQAADRLGVKSSTVHSVRRELHRKLGVQHRGELVRHAVQKGFVHFTADGVHPRGFAMLRAECSRRREKRGEAVSEPLVASGIGSSSVAA